MLELVLTACLLADTRHCQTVKQVYHAPPAVCMRGAVFEVVKWSQEHPGWHVTRWKCGPYKAQTDA